MLEIKISVAGLVGSRKTSLLNYLGAALKELGFTETKETFNSQLQPEITLIMHSDKFCR